MAQGWGSFGPAGAILATSTLHPGAPSASIQIPQVTGASKQRTFLYDAAFAAMAAVFGGTLIVAGLLFGARDQAAGASPSAAPSASTVAGGAAGEITITAFDLGFEPAMVHVAAPGTYVVTFASPRFS